MQLRVQIGTRVRGRAQIEANALSGSVQAASCGIGGINDAPVIVRGKGVRLLMGRRLGDWLPHWQAVPSAERDLGRGSSCSHAAILVNKISPCHSLLSM